MAQMNMIQALNSAMDIMLGRDPNVVILGEDVGYFGGVFRVTDGLQRKYGEHRVLDTPIPEGGTIAAAIGMGVIGLRPVAEIHFADYIYPGYDQIVSELARFDQPTWATHDAFLRVMVTAGASSPTGCCRAVERRWGRIINIASLAGHVPAPAGHTLYAASKSFLIRFSEALAAERAADGVFTTAVCPGFTYSEFHDVTGTRAKVSEMPAFLWMDASSVAEQGYAAVMRGEPVYINGRVNRAIARLARVLPAGLVRRLVGSSGKRFRHVD